LIGGARLLERINGKRVITKDLAPLITSRRESRLETFGLLRSIKDGTISSDFGTPEGYICQDVSFDWIIAVTPAIESVRQIESLLGERYVDLHWIPGNREEMAYKAALNNPRLPEIREQLSIDICSLLARTKEVSQKQTAELSEKEKRLIAKYADIAALCRSPIQKDAKGNLLAIPKPEIGTSLAQDFSRLTLGLRLLGITEWKPYIERLAWDCIPSVRAKILRALYHQPKSANEIYERTRIPRSTIYYHLSDLRFLGVVKDEPPELEYENSRTNLDLAEEDYEVRKSLVVNLPPIPKKVR